MSQATLEHIVAEAVGSAFRRALAGAEGPWRLPAPVRPLRRARPAASSAEAAAPAPAAAAQPGSAPAASPSPRASQNDIIERVRADLQSAYDGRPVSPDRLAFRLKSDRDLVDAALT